MLYYCFMYILQGADSSMLGPDQAVNLSEPDIVSLQVSFY
jgi:hypothetical protein